MWPFRRKSQKADDGSPKIDLGRYVMEWADGRTFFELQCKYGQTDIEPGRGIVALVLDARKEFGTAVAIKIEADGRQLPILRVAAPDGGFIVPAYTPSNRGDTLKPGDVVVWVPERYVPEVAVAVGDKRCGWVGLIRAKVSLQQSAKPGSLKIESEYN